MSDGQSQELVTAAHEVEREIIAEAKRTRKAGWKLGALLHAAHEERAWELLGHESEQVWIDSPEIDIGYSTAKALMQVFREVVIERDIDPDRVKELDVRRVQMALPAVRDGKVSIDDALSDAEVLNRDAMKLKYKGDPNRAIEAKPDSKAECPQCGTWVEPDRLKAES